MKPVDQASGGCWACAAGTSPPDSEINAANSNKAARLVNMLEVIFILIP
jgi:hypothetical protein